MVDSARLEKPRSGVSTNCSRASFLVVIHTPPFLFLRAPSWGTSGYRDLYFPLWRLNLHGVSLHLYSTLYILSPLLWSTTLNLWLPLKTPTETPGWFAFPPYNYTAPASTASGAALRTCSPSFLWTVSMDLGQPVPPNQFKLSYFIFSTILPISKAQPPLPIATTTTAIINHERPPICSVPHCYPQYPWCYPLYTGICLLILGGDAPPNLRHQARYSRRNLRLPCQNSYT